MKINTPPPSKPRIEMLPLIDIVFLLLVVFIYAMLSMAVHRGLPVELPVSSAAGTDRELTLSVTVQASAQGQGALIYVDQDRVHLKELADTLRSRAARIEEGGSRQEPGVQLFADSKVSCQLLFRVLDKISLAGISRISLQAEEAAP